MLTSNSGGSQIAPAKSAVLLLLLSAGFVYGRIESAAAQAKTGVRPVGDDKIIATVDNWPIHITYYKSTAGKNAAVIVLLHGKSSNKLIWSSQNAGGRFVRRLHDLKYAVITVDLRKHGQSIGKMPGDADPYEENNKTAKKKKEPRGDDTSNLKAADYKAMVLCDLAGVKRFIFTEHQEQNLNMRKLAIVAPEMSAALALRFTAIDWSPSPVDDAPVRGRDVKALVLISPSTTIPGLVSRHVIRHLKALPVSFFVCVGKTDKKDKQQANNLFLQLGGKKREDKKIFYREYPTSFGGTDLFGKNFKIEAHILDFLEHHLQELDVKWRDRR